jgi:prevent-host-death family protein
MEEVSISVTAAARNFSDCVNRARYQGTVFLLHKGGRPVARIVPEAESRSTAADLAKALREVSLNDDEFAAWRSELSAGREKLAPPDDKWR